MTTQKDWIWIPMASPKPAEAGQEGTGFWIPMNRVAPGPGENPPPPPPGQRGVWIPYNRLADAVRQAAVARRGTESGIWIPMNRLLDEVRPVGPASAGADTIRIPASPTPGHRDPRETTISVKAVVAAGVWFSA